MAIIEGLKGLEVTVHSAGKCLDEYPYEGEWTHQKFSHISADRRSITYTECVSDAEFQTNLDVTPPFDQTSTPPLEYESMAMASLVCTGP